MNYRAVKVLSTHRFYFVGKGDKLSYMSGKGKGKGSYTSGKGKGSYMSGKGKGSYMSGKGSDMSGKGKGNGKGGYMMMGGHMGGKMQIAGGKMQSKLPYNMGVMDYSGKGSAPSGKGKGGT